MREGPIGLVCPPDHPVFAAVADRLRDEGHAVRFLEPGVPIPHETIDGLAALANKKIRVESFQALHYADRTGVPTWNDFFVTTATSCRLVALHALDAVGCTTPPVHFSPPAGEYVSKPLYAWEGEPHVGGEDDFYQDHLRTTGVDEKYYAVRTPDGVAMTVLRVRSKLTGDKAILGTADPDPGLAAAVTRLLDRTGANALGVDFVRVPPEGPDDDATHYALDVNPAPSFRGTGLETALADSIAALTTSPGR